MAENATGLGGRETHSPSTTEATMKALRWSIYIGLLYLFGSLIFPPPDGSEFLVFGIGSIVVLLSAIFSLLFQLHSSIPDTKPLEASLDENHREILEELADHRRAVTEATSAYTKEVRDGMMVGRKLIRWLSEDREKGIQNTFYRLSNCGSLVRDIGEDSLQHHITCVEVQGRGFNAHGEDFSLDAYARCWRRLIELQREARESGGESLRVLITHSNDIGIWLPERNPRVFALLKQQEEFTDVGGKITRLLISSRHPAANDDYEQAMKFMRDRGIQPLFLHHRHDYHYDFMWVDPLGLVVKWYSGSQGKMISRCEITDANADVENSRTMWSYLYDLAVPRDVKGGGAATGQ